MTTEHKEPIGTFDFADKETIAAVVEKAMRWWFGSEDWKTERDKKINKESR